MATALEKAARLAWAGWGEYAQWTTCAGCGRWQYCRAKHRPGFLCLDCFDQKGA